MIPRLIVRKKVMIFSDDQQRDCYSLVKCTLNHSSRNMKEK